MPAQSASSLGPRSSLRDGRRVNADFAAELASAPSAREHVVAGIDTKNGHIAVKGWKAQVALTPDEAIPQLEPHVCRVSLHACRWRRTHAGLSYRDRASACATSPQRQLIVAGGIRSQQEIDASTPWALMPWSAWLSTPSSLRSSNSQSSRPESLRALTCASDMLEETWQNATKGNDRMTARQSGIRLAKRLDEVGFSDIVQIRNKVMAMRAEGLQVHSLHGGEPYFETPDDIKYAAVKALVENQTHYAPSSGLLPLRKALAEKLAAKNNIHVTTDEVIVTVGGSQGLVRRLPERARSRRRRAVFSPYWTPDRRPGHGRAGAPAAGAHHHRAPQWHSQNARAVLDAQDARHLLQHAAESQRAGLYARRS